jgi:small-conductance mechanosensitive channel/CRP-like cAMP-binding protein
MDVEWVRRWGFALLGAGLLIVAFLINRFAPQKRRRLRHALLLYLLFLLLTAAEGVLARTRLDPTSTWVGSVHLVAGLLAAFTSVNLAGLLVFDIALPVFRFHVVAITADLVVGLAYLVAALAVLKASGVGASSVVTTSAVVSGVIALGLQTTLGNVIGGVALQIDGSIHVGDWIQVADGTQGKVVAIRWRHTVVETRNWDTLIVPNASLLAQNIVVLGKRAGQAQQRRMWVYFNVDFRFPPSRVVQVVRDALWGSPLEGVAADPKPSVICYDLAHDVHASFAYYAVRYFLTDLANDDPTSSRVRAVVYAALRRADIPLARPAQTLFVEHDEGAIGRVQRHRERRLSAIGRIELFRSLTEIERQYVCDHLRDVPFTAGETITRQGAVAHWLYVLAEGEVDVRRHTEDGTAVKTVAHIVAPGFFGEMGLLTGAPRRADVIATTDVECYRLDKEGFEQILKERPEIAEALSKTLASREPGLDSATEGLDEEAQRARAASAEARLLDKIQEFFGLSRTTQV